jgi:hypothetical protein
LNDLTKYVWIYLTVGKAVNITITLRESSID